MSAGVKPIPEGYTSITPHLAVKGAGEALDFYSRAFGATEICRLPGPDGQTIMHAEIEIAGSRLMLNDEFPDMGAFGPKSLGGSPVVIHLYVDDADAWFERAVKAGAEATMPIQDAFWGDRYGMITDPFGHRWGIATHKEDLTPDEIAQRAAQAFSGQPC